MLAVDKEGRRVDQRWIAPGGNGDYSISPDKIE